ncbi:Eco57I restriction-modification methylase domain-containing protein [Bacillus mojavensis]|uniref:Eco57I restriction-modification methylase domain-containing protein n=1 Tax=Bacillus mojavensis TaxID=72360 RepID=UPI002DBA881B|nr:Eco57I restriction-modification methylase domain-containing protein [Bacillus mojavensis]MEC1636413.1 Eco57I restriction-modification methylase domain-containing protein [Bacillus mojavensis]
MDKVFLEVIDESSNIVIKSRYESINKDNYEQFFTPMSVANYMSSMFKETKKNEIKILDPGAGIGNLTAAFIFNVLKWRNKPKKIHATLYEIDYTLISELKKNLEICMTECDKNNIKLEVEIINKDFLICTINQLSKIKNKNKYDYIIINPPYKKMNTDSFHKKLITTIGIDVPNYYAAFVSLSIRLLSKNAQLVFITPRSFCNGQYFKSFRNDLLKNIKLEKIHHFISRKSIFYDNVLQEIVIFFISKKNQKNNDNIDILESKDNDFSRVLKVRKRFDNIVFPEDQEKIIRIIRDDNFEIVKKMRSLPCSLDDLNINVSTGPIVDFREKDGLLSFKDSLFSIPLIYPENFSNGFIKWPVEGKKAPFLIEDKSNTNNLRPQGFYVLVKRFSTKEETKRIVAAVYDYKLISTSKVGFDNKTNYYHISKSGLKSEKFAKGLSLYLNSSLVDFYFRTFSGSTQVNVTDLKSLKYPLYSDIEKLGETYFGHLPNQNEIDKIVNRIIFNTNQE